MNPKIARGGATQGDAKDRKVQNELTSVERMKEYLLRDFAPSSFQTGEIG